MFIRVPNVLSTEEIAAYNAQLDAAAWVSGASTAHGKAKEVKLAENVPPDHPTAVDLAQRLIAKLVGTELFRAAAMPHTILPPRFVRYGEGMRYGEHLDLPLMNQPGKTVIRTDVSVTVALNGPDDYDGGSLVLHTDLGEQRIRARAGDAVVYPSTTLHAVETVTRGVRRVAITWVQSMVRESERRRILFDLALAATRLEAAGSTEATLLRKSHYNLMRMWIDH